MGSAAVLDREEYIEQVYFFRTFRERLAQNVPAQEVLESVHEEILSTTRLPYAIQFLATELKHSGQLASGFERLGHYFTPFQTFVIRQSEEEGQRFSTTMALLVLEREAQYRSGSPTKPGLFVYQFESLSRNRLGYDEGLTCMAQDPLYDDSWREYLTQVRKTIGTVDFADLVYLRSDYCVQDHRRTDPGYESPMPPLFGEKEGKIAKANRGREPLFLFAALQRQLSYPEVPRPRARDDESALLESMQTKLRQVEARLRLIEGELRGQVDWNKFGKPELLQEPPEGEQEIK